MSATSAVSSATSEPAAPIAIPTVALAIAGASLTPSPTIATGISARSFLIASTFCSGIRSPQASLSPDLGGDRFGDALMIARNHDHPADTQFAQPRDRLTRGGARRVHEADRTQVARALGAPPSSCGHSARNRSIASTISGERGAMPSAPNISALPMLTVSPSTCAWTPRPVRLLRSVAAGNAAHP